MNSGIVDLYKLYAFVRNYPDIPHRTSDKVVYIEYRSLVRSIIYSVPKIPGWYCWVRDPIEVIYVGQSSKKKTSSLYSRLQEELLEEYVAFWTSINLNAAELLIKKYKGHYKATIERAAKKSGVNRIVWVGYPSISEGVLDVIEQKLVYSFNPTANIVRRDYSEIDVPQYDEVRLLFEKIITKAV